MNYIFAILFFTAALASPVFAVELPISNAGFVQSNIWYSKDPFYAGEKIRIYTVIFNGNKYELTGSVEFLDNGTLIGKTAFILPVGVRTRDLWVDWKASEGKHTITARLVDVVTDGPNGKQAVVLANNETGKSELTVELDPIAKEAQLKAQTDKSAETQNQVLEKVDDAVQAVNNVIPTPVKEGVSLGINIIEALRTEEAYNFSLARENKVRDIEVIKAEEQIGHLAGKPETVVSATDAILNTAKKPFAYVMLGLFTVLHYIFEWKILFYGIIFYILYRLFRWIIRRFRDR